MSVLPGDTCVECGKTSPEMSFIVGQAHSSRRHSSSRIRVAKVRYKLGDVVMIPLNDAGFAFGRMLRDASIAVYAFVSEEAVDVKHLVRKKVLFDTGVFTTNIANGKWVIIGNMPFKSTEESWPRPHYVRDVIDEDKYQIYHKGELTPATKKQVRGLDEAVMYKPEELVREIRKRLAV